MNRSCLVLSLLIISCNPLLSTDISVEDSQMVEDETLKPYFVAFSEKYERLNEKEAFVFFSDPHLLGYHSSLSYGEEQLFDSSFKSMRAIYN